MQLPSVGSILVHFVGETEYFYFYFWFFNFFVQMKGRMNMRRMDL